MKSLSKIFLAAFALILFYSTSNLAWGGDGGISFGVKGGVNFSNVTGNYTGDKPSTLTGFHIGGIVDIGINSNFSVVPELLYTTKGAHQESTTIITAGNNTFEDKWDVNRTLNYLEIPILAMYKLESGLHFEAGPYIGFLMSATAKGSYSHIATSGSSSADVVNPIDESSTDGFASTDVGLAFGLGYRLSGGLGFGLRYDLGLSDIYDPSGTDEYKNSTIGISLSYMFGSK